MQLRTDQVQSGLFQLLTRCKGDFSCFERYNANTHGERDVPQHRLSCIYGVPCATLLVPTMTYYDRCAPQALPYGE